MTRLLGLLVATGVSLGMLAERSVAFNPGSPTFEFSGLGGAIPDFDTSIAVFPATPATPISFIKTLELEIEGLTHTAPGDLDIYLISPFEGEFIEIMTDRGGGSMNPVNNVDLIFNNAALGTAPTPLTMGTYLPDGLLANRDEGFSEFVGRNPGQGTWLLLVIDDTAGGVGSIQSFTLRGTVPEPMSLSLLALGAAALLRRRRSIA